MVNVRRVVFRSLAVFGVLAAGAPIAGAADAPVQGRIVNGTPVAITAVPWQVAVFSRFDDGSGYDCGGSILDATTVLTAAHCVDGVVIGASPYSGGLGVTAGISNINAELDTDRPQTRTVISARVHPFYNPGAGVQTTGDIAVLTLNQPLDLSGSYATAIALPPSAGPADITDVVTVGPSVSVSGFGLQDSNLDPDGKLYALPAQVSDPKFCASEDNAIALCVRSPIGVACSGDSGGPLVTMTAGGPVLVGVVSNGPEECTPGDGDNYVNLTAPENRRFLEGAVAPPRAPRVISEPTISMPRGLFGGGSVVCSGSFSGLPTTVRWTLSDAADGRLLATKNGSGDLSYTVQPADVGHFAVCRGVAVNEGGVAYSLPVMSQVTMALSAGTGAAPGSGGSGSAAPVTVPLRLAEMTLKVTAKRSVPRGKLLRVNAALAGLFSQAETGTLCVKHGGGQPVCTSLAIKGKATLATPLRYRISKRARRGSVQRFVFTATVIGKNPSNGSPVQETRQMTLKVKVSK